ncbi:PilZ domain-containing protein [Bdellovibrio bacteriovorus]|uniref:PilZ domain-containing protein n=1 Tax=Bdellovibrio TaxID=958 RepID=UPI0035A820AC
MTQQGEIFVIVRVENLTQRLVQAFLNWGKLNVKLSFIFIAQTIEKTAQQVAFANTQMLFLFESEAPRIADLVTRRLLGLAVKSRKQERITVQSQVMLKKSVFAEESPTGRGVQFLREGQMQDFSKGGAQISIGQGQVKIKDFISLMYQNRHGQWVSVESQVRWVVSTAAGDQIIGVQFLAVSA